MFFLLLCCWCLQEMIDKLRKMHPNNHQAVLDMVISHQGLPLKIELVKRILSTLVLPSPVPYRSLLRRFAALSSKGTADVAVRARQLLVSAPETAGCLIRSSTRFCLSGVTDLFFLDLAAAGSEPAGGPACSGGACPVRTRHVQ
jgi:hypothetical protein